MNIFAKKPLTIERALELCRAKFENKACRIVVDSTGPIGVTDEQRQRARDELSALTPERPPVHSSTDKTAFPDDMALGEYRDRSALEFRVWEQDDRRRRELNSIAHAFRYSIFIGDPTGFDTFVTIARPAAEAYSLEELLAQNGVKV